jgi:hypothetical protein
MSRLQFRILKKESPGGRRVSGLHDPHRAGGVDCEAAPTPTSARRAAKDGG